MQIELSARELAEKRILDMERRKRIGLGARGSSESDPLSLQNVIRTAKAAQEAMATLSRFTWKYQQEQAAATEKNMAAQAAMFRRLRAEQEAAAAAKKAADRQAMLDTEKNMAAQVAIFRRLRAEQEAAAAARAKADPFSMQNVVKTAAAGEAAMQRLAQATWKMQQAQAAATAKADPFNLQNIVRTAAAGQAALERLAQATWRAQQAEQAAGGLFGTRTLGAMQRFSQQSRGVVDVLNDISFKMFVITFASKQMFDTLLHTFVQVGENVEMARFKLETFTKSTRTFGDAFKIAQELGVGLETVTGVVQRFAVANQTIGMTNQELLSLTRNIVALGKIGGASQQELNAGLIQLGQAFASGRFQGDEFRSVMENIPLVALKLAQALNTDIAGLRQMSTAGELGRKELMKLKDEIPGLQKILENLPLTTEVALQRASNAWDVFINQVLRTQGIESTAMAIDEIATAMTGWGTWVEQHSSTTLAWLQTLKDIVIALAAIAVAMAALRRAAGVFVAMTALMKGFGNATVAAAAGATTLGHTLKLLWAAMGPISIAAGVIGYAISRFGEHQRDATERAQELTGKLEELEEQYARMNRRELMAWQRQTSSAMELNVNTIRETAMVLQDMEEKIAHMEAKRDSALSGEEYRSRMQERINGARDAYAELVIEFENMLKEQQRLTLAAEKQGNALNNLTADAQATAAAMAKVNGELKKIFTDIPVFQRDLELKLQELKYAQEDPDTARYRASLFKVGQDAQRSIAEAMSQASAGSLDPRSLDTTLKAIRERTDLAFEDLKIQERLRKTYQESREAAKGAADEAEKAYQRILKLSDAQAAGLQKALPYIERAARAYNIDPELMIAVARRESGGVRNDPFGMSATSPAGARGTMQIMPKTAAGLSGQTGIPASDILNDLSANTMAAAKLLSDLLRQYGTTEKALAAYNGGNRGVRDPLPETRAYVPAVMNDYQKLMMGGEGAGAYIRQQEDIRRANEDGWRESQQRILGTVRDFNAQYALLALERQQADIEVNRQTELSDATKNQMLLANALEYNQKVDALNRQLNDERTQYELETQALRDSLLSTWEQREADTARQILEIRREQAASDGVITVEMMNARIDALKKVAEAEGLTAQLANGMGDAVANAMGEFIKGGQSAKDVMENLLTSIRDMIVQLTVVEPLARAVSDALKGSSSSGSAGGFLAKIVGAAAGSAVGGASASGFSSGFGSANIGSIMTFARGGAGAFQLQPGVYAHPTFFRMAEPGMHAFARGTGLLGEAGPEAVLPLRRGPDGKLGVSGGGVSMNVVVNTLPGESARVTQTQEGLTIDIIKDAIATDILRGGNRISRSLDTARARRG